MGLSVSLGSRAVLHYGNQVASGSLGNLPQRSLSATDIGDFELLAALEQTPPFTQHCLRNSASKLVAKTQCAFRDIVADRSARQNPNLLNPQNPSGQHPVALAVGMNFVSAQLRASKNV